MRTLLEQRAKIIKDMRALTEAPEGEGGDLSTQQTTKFSALKGELELVESKLERQAVIDDAERRMQGTPITGDIHLDHELRDFSLIKAIQHQLGAKVDAGKELEISSELARRESRKTDGFFMPYSVFERRAANTITSASAGSMIGTDHLGGQFVDMLREANPLTAFGVRTLSGLVGNAEIPRLKESTSVGWFGENATIAETGAQFDSVTMKPKHVGAWTEYSRNMLLQSSPDIENILRSDLAQVLSLEVARATINGSGTGAEPKGILNTTGIHEIAKPTVDMDYVPELAGALFASNVETVSFVVDAAFKVTVDKKLTTDGLPVGASAFFRNHPHKFTSLLSADRVMLAGDFSQVIQGTWSSVEVLVNPYMESVYKKGNVALRIILTMDVAIRHPEAFATFKVE